MDTPDLARLTILERVHLLYDSTLRRHGELRDRHDDSFVQLQAMVKQHVQLMFTLTEVLISVETTLHAIKELLDRGNGH